jgi:pimeloyl-ACP methyl ester carboxylesterase
MRMTRFQKIVIAVLGVLDLAVICGLGFAVYTTVTRSAAPQQSADLSVSVTPTPTSMPTLTPTEEVFVPTFVSTDCAFEIPASATVECGFVSVLEDRDGDIADVIRLAVAVYRSAYAASDPVIYLHGGPGGNAVESSVYRYEEFIAPILETRDVILFDQRGAGLSEPELDCEEVKTLYLEDLKRPLSADERTARYTDALRACRDRLVGAGVNLAAYTSAASAADVNDIVAALGYEQVNLYGVSYGTRLALTVMRDFPQIVRSAVLDSVLPIEARPYNDGASMRDYALGVLFDDCAVDPECSAAFPGLKTVFDELVVQLNTQPITVEVSALNGTYYTATVSGVGLVNTSLWALYSSSMIPVVPRTIYQIRDGDYSSLSYVLSLPERIYGDTSLGVVLSVDCHEQVFATTPEELGAGLADYYLAEAAGLSSVYDSGEALFSVCEMWGAAPFDPRDGELLVSDIPTLIIAGEYDPITPPAYGRQVAGNLSNSYFFEFPGMGHAPSVGASDPCPLEVAVAFLRTPNVDPFRSCIAKMEGPQFVIPLESMGEITFVPFVSEEFGIQGIVPSGWEEIGRGFYNRNQFALDATQLGLQASNASQEEWLTWLTEQFQQVGLDEAPRFVSEHQANGFAWSFYATTFRGEPVDIALAEGDGLTMLVALLSSRSEHDALYEAVFLPVTSALTPIE